MNNTHATQSDTPAGPEAESFGDEALDKLLEEGVLKGYARMDLALVLAGVFIVAMWGLFTFYAAPALPFIYQDYERIVDNPALHGIATISEGWDATALRPIVAFTLAVEWLVGNGQPGVFHVVNALLHTLNAVLVFLLCRKIYPSERVSEVVCLAPALLFLVHPISSTPALHISERGVSLALLFGLLAFLAYLQPERRDDETRRGGRTLGLAMVLLTAAWAAHAAVWALPIVFAAGDIVVHRRVRWRRMAPLAFLAAAFLVVHITTRAALQQSVPGIEGLWGQAGTFAGYITGIVDFGLPLPVQSGGSSTIGIVLWLAVLASGLGTLWAAPRVGLGLIWTAVLLPSAGLLVPDARSAAFYLGFAGTVVMVPALIAALPARARSITGVLVAAVILVLSATTFSHSLAWKDEEALIVRALEACQECEAIDARLATVYLERARAEMSAAQQVPGSTQSAAQLEAARAAYRAAIPHLERVLETNPADVESWLELGQARAALGDREGMMAAYETAREIDPSSGEAARRLAAAILAAAAANPSHEARIRARDLYEVAHQAQALHEGDYAQFARLLTQLGEFEAADALLNEGVEKTGSGTLATMREQNAKSVDALKRREERLGDLSGRERTYEQAFLLHLRRQFLKSSYLLEADLDQYGFREATWLLLARNKRAMNQLDAFLREYDERGDISHASWLKLARQFESANDPEAAEAVRRAIPSGTGTEPTTRPPEPVQPQ